MSVPNNYSFCSIFLKIKHKAKSMKTEVTVRFNGVLKKIAKRKKPPKVEVKETVARELNKSYIVTGKTGNLQLTKLTHSVELGFHLTKVLLIFYMP